MTKRSKHLRTVACSLTAIGAVLIGSQALAAERELDAHQHGHGYLNIAIEGSTLYIELETPGADIVGFEHPARSDDDKAAIEDAKGRLSDPIGLFGIPAEASCTLVEVSVEPVGYGLGEDDDHHDEHDEHDEGSRRPRRGHTTITRITTTTTRICTTITTRMHDDHDEDMHDDHDEDAHDDHDEDDHAEDMHDDHDEHEGEMESHAEFHVEYRLQCDDPAAIASLTLTYFDVFSGAEELQVNLITDDGQSRQEVTPDAPVVNLGGN